MRVSVVVPTLNEADLIADLVAGLLREAEEVIVVDGGSTDATATLARTAGATVVVAAPSTRSVALNIGAGVATGDVLYFVHADTRPPAGFAREIRQLLGDGRSAGCFRLRFDSRHWLLRFSGWCTRFDVGLIRFGDQSLFVRRDLFESIGGFDERLAVMEDYEVVRRLRRRSGFVIVPRAITASARQYRRLGVYRLQLGVYPLVIGLYHMGVGQNRLVRIYDRLMLHRG
jgi:rSAM/selenodomain-associated transferase 2